MKKLCGLFWHDEAGFLLSAELVLVATVAVLGLSVMLVGVRDSVGAELNDLANSFRSIDQSYGYAGIRGCTTLHGYSSWTAGSGFLDEHIRGDEAQPDIIVDDAVLGAAPAVVVPPAAPCVAVLPPPHHEIGGIQGMFPAPQGDMPVPEMSPVPGPHLEAPRLEAPCLDCQQSGLQNGAEHSFVLPPPSSDIPPASVRRHWQQYAPPYYSPGYSLPPGPLQVW